MAQKEHEDGAGWGESEKAHHKGTSSLKEAKDRAVWKSGKATVLIVCLVLGQVLPTFPHRNLNPHYQVGAARPFVRWQSKLRIQQCRQ